MYTRAAGFGDDVAAPAAPPTVADKTPHFTRQALALMGISGIPWIPVVAGAWLGDKTDFEHGKLMGASLGFALSVLTIRHINKMMAGSIT